MSEITERLDAIEKRVQQFNREYKQQPEALAHFHIASNAIERACTHRLQSKMLVDIERAEKALDDAFAALS